MKQEISLYIHIPFCVRKCLYCDFPSFSGMDGMFEDYVRRLCREMGEAAPSFQGIGVKSVFFGGGTPSILPPALMGRIMDKIMSAYDVNSDAEISMEANPGTADEAKFEAYAEAGVNRLSLGIQSFDEASLKRLGRIHDLCSTLPIQILLSRS